MSVITTTLSTQVTGPPTQGKAEVIITNNLQAVFLCMEATTRAPILVNIYHAYHVDDDILQTRSILGKRVYFVESDV